jgi:hypothetical protein
LDYTVNQYLQGRTRQLTLLLDQRVMPQHAPSLGEGLGFPMVVKGVKARALESVVSFNSIPLHRRSVIDFYFRSFILSSIKPIQPTGLSVLLSSCDSLVKPLYFPVHLPFVSSFVEMLFKYATTLCLFTRLASLLFLIIRSFLPMTNFITKYVSVSPRSVTFMLCSRTTASRGTWVRAQKKAGEF